MRLLFLTLLVLLFLGREYVKGIIDKKELKFIHITKTGGTSIEDAGLAAGVKWGMNDKEYEWHHGVFPLKNAAYKKKYDWFTVVRNPYSRIVSEFHCEWGGVGFNASNYTKQEFNQFLLRKMVAEEKLFFSCGKNMNPHHIATRGCLGNHYTEQYKYIQFSPHYNFHILHYENLAKEFADLMKLYNLTSVTLSNASSTGGAYTNGHDRVFTEQDLEPWTKKYINEKYRLDLIMFGYHDQDTSITNELRSFYKVK